MEVRRYGRYWAVYDGAVLVVVAVYKKGAEEVVRRLIKASEAMTPPAMLAAEHTAHYAIERPVKKPLKV